MTVAGWPEDTHPAPGVAPVTTGAVLTTAAVGGKAFWYLTRASGLVALVLLTATIVLGVVASVGWTTERWPRFLSQDVHRNVSLLCLVFLGIHVATTVLDGYVPIGLRRRVRAVPARPTAPSTWVSAPSASTCCWPCSITSAPPPPHRLRLVAVRPLAGLPVLADRPASTASAAAPTPSSPSCSSSRPSARRPCSAAFAWRLTTGRTLPVGTAAAAGVGAVVAHPGHRRLRRPRPAPPGLVPPLGDLARRCSPSWRPRTARRHGTAAPRRGTAPPPRPAAGAASSRRCPSPARSPGPSPRRPPTPRATSR